MKKAKLIPIVLTLTLVIFCIGFLLGRNFNHSKLIQSGTVMSVSDFSEETEECSAVSEPSRKVNINKASAEELTLLPGIGPSLATKIVAYREENGLFKSIDDLCNVEGIGEKKLMALWEYVSLVGSP